MRKTLNTILTLFILKSAFGQSPFDYGQNKNVYFISTELRNKLDIKTIYTIDQRHDNDLGGMGENWDVTLISFDTNSITADWYPISLDSTFKYNFDSLTTNMRFLNGTSYEFSNGQLISYGGGGYGSFEWKKITRFSDTVSIVATSCVGHCGDQPVNYSKNIFNKTGQLLYIISYPTPGENGEMNEDEMSLQEYEKFLNSNVNSENIPDTLQYQYDNKGLLLNTSEESRIENKNEVRLLFTNSNDLATSKFHQCYVGKIKMEKFILKKLGFTPDLILLEIYGQAVFSFTLNHSDKKYYRTNDIMLEK